MTAIQFTRYRVLALVNGAGYTLDLVRDPNVARTRYETGGHRAAAIYKGADTLVLAVEQAGVDGLTVRGSRQALAQRSLLGPRKPGGRDGGHPARRPRRRHTRHRTSVAGADRRERGLAGPDAAEGSPSQPRRGDARRGRLPGPDAGPRR